MLIFKNCMNESVRGAKDLAAISITTKKVNHIYFFQVFLVIFIFILLIELN